MSKDFLQPVSYDKLKPISYDMAKELVNTEIELDVLLKAIYNHVTSNDLKVNDFVNKHFFKEGRNPVSNLQKGKVKTICPFHETENQDTTVLKGHKNGSEKKPDMVRCFRGGCSAEKAMTPVMVYMVMVLGIDPKMTRPPLNKAEIAKTAFGKAVYALAKFAGYKVVSGEKKRLTFEEKRKIMLQNILTDATEAYHQEFLTNEIAKEYYLVTRGFQYATKDAMELAKKYKIGFAPENFPSDFIFKKLEAKYKLEDMIETSLVKWMEFKEGKGNTNQGKPLDFHSDALIIPYWSKGKVVKHYSRGLNATKQFRHMRGAGTSDEPLNFYEGTHFETVNIIEGEISLYSMLALDFENSLATYGTNGLSEEHVQMLLKVKEESNGLYCKTIYIIYDGDGPGRSAAVKTGKLLTEKGFDVRVVLLPEGLDPNDILVKHKENAKAIMEKLYVEAVSYYTFLALNSISKDFSSTSDRLEEMKVIKQTIDEHGISDPTQVYLVAKEFAEIVDIPVELVWDSWKPKENKNVEAFEEDSFVFVTNDLEGYFLTKNAFKGKTSYVEDVSFEFLNGKELSIKSMVVDEKFYNDKEKEMIKTFCEQHNVKYHSFYDFKTICEINVNSQMLIQTLTKDK